MAIKMECSKGFQLTKQINWYVILNIKPGRELILGQQLLFIKLNLVQGYENKASSENREF